MCVRVGCAWNKLKGKKLYRNTLSICWQRKWEYNTNYKVGVVTFVDKVRAKMVKVVVSFEQFWDFGSISKISWCQHVIKGNFLLTIQSNFIRVSFLMWTEGPKTLMLLASKALLLIALLIWPYTNKFCKPHSPKVFSSLN